MINAIWQEKKQGEKKKKRKKEETNLYIVHVYVDCAVLYPASLKPQPKTFLCCRPPIALTTRQH
ncbi:unnamed protein product [Prunus brigantina]